MERYFYDLLNLTDTESSSSSDDAVFERQPFVFELHDMNKDDPPAPEPTAEQVKQKSKKRSKRKKQPSSRSETSVSSDSQSEAVSVPSLPIEETAREQFFDALGSYHVLPESQVSGSIATNPLSVTGLMAQSDHAQILKMDRQLPTDLGQSAAEKVPSTISKRPE